MPGGKLRLKGLFTGGAQVGTTGDYIKHILAGSLAINVGSIGGGTVAGSTVCEVGTISNLTASHAMVATERFGSRNACVVFVGALTGVGQASFVWMHGAGSGAGTAASHAATLDYFAFRT